MRTATEVQRPRDTLERAGHEQAAANCLIGDQVNTQPSTRAPHQHHRGGAVDTMVRGQTLRDLLLNAHTFATTGTMTRLAAAGALIVAAVMLHLWLLGFTALRRVWPAAELGAPNPPAGTRPIHGTGQRAGTRRSAGRECPPNTCS